MFLGPRSVIYPAPDLAAATAWFTAALGTAPYFDSPFYVGFQVAGYELGLDPNADPAVGAVTYWGVADLDAAVAQLTDRGATLSGEGVRDVGDDIRMATVLEPGGNTVGLIANPHFAPPPS